MYTRLHDKEGLYQSVCCTTQHPTELQSPCLRWPLLSPSSPSHWILTSLKLSEQNLLMREVFPTAASPRVTRVREWGETTWPLYTDILTLSPHSSDWHRKAQPGPLSRDHCSQSQAALLLFIVTTEVRHSKPNVCSVKTVKTFSFKLHLFTQVTLLQNFPTLTPTLLWLDQQD